MANELNTCVLCGQKYMGFGNSTCGYWRQHGATETDDTRDGERLRCCDSCNKYRVVPARIRISKGNS